MKKQSREQTESKEYRGLQKMGVAKVVELIGESEKGWMEAVEVCVSEATQTLRHVGKIEVADFSVSVENGAIARYTARCRVSFDLEQNHHAH